ncbi:transmembrane protein, putative [Medicago truncatula]|uniref:Transmembrane protein, putative n=1 Tax=Medicago truncatula TaxID=3880 RepID=G7KLC5_MEDTR|nr:transmembrane protein, putative [Medicago truncatula]
MELSIVIFAKISFVISGKLYDGSKIDIWNCGTILYALLFGINFIFKFPILKSYNKQLEKEGEIRASMTNLRVSESMRVEKEEDGELLLTEFEI